MDMDSEYVLTINSDDELEKGPVDSQELDANFVFDLTEHTTGGGLADLDVVQIGTKRDPISVDDIIARRKLKRKRVSQEWSSSDTENDDAEQGPEGSLSGQDSEVEHRSSPLLLAEDLGRSDDDSDPEETQQEKDRKAAYFDSDYRFDGSRTSFLEMNLSRPILKALTSQGFHKPTPIQAATIPVALLGKDIVGAAVTGSGKTAAFAIPSIERLLYRAKGAKAAATRCLILVPTRELAVQCFEVCKKLAVHTDIQFCLVVGGLSLKSQEASLRLRPDVVIATPGRLIDHLQNSPSFSLDSLDILILDEADRMLSDGFADELGEIVKSCPRSRQTMLFSATMTDSVDELVKMSLNKPVRLFVDAQKSTAAELTQEFVRIRAGRESERSAILLCLCTRTFKSKTIVFLRSKKLAHQLRILFTLAGLSCDELHGDLTQEQRLQALHSFRDGKIDFLMATDLASRGLDIAGVETVINYDMPGQIAQYLHRVGRTARAGRNGRSVTLVGESDRKMLKSVIKHATRDGQIRHRLVPQDAVTKWVQRLEEFKPEVSDVLAEEKEEKLLRQADMELRKGENMINHSEEIFAKPPRTWFQTNKEKAAAEAASRTQYEAGFKPTGGEKINQKRQKFSGLSRKAKRRKLAAEEDAKLGDQGSIKAAIRTAKKAVKPTKLRSIPNAPKKSSTKLRETSKRGMFDREMKRR